MASKLTFFVVLVVLLIAICSSCAFVASQESTSDAAKASTTTTASFSDANVVEKPSRTPEELAALLEASEKGERLGFQAEINKLLGILINSLYTNKEIFLRELISNASDALDKIRFLSLTNKDVLKTAPEMEIQVSANEADKTITIRDTGVGMTRQELISNLGTIAKSGTKAFLEKLQQGEAGDSSNNLIGQFGVGFYSAFLVADKVVVASKSNDDDQHIWSSTADGSFTVAKDPRGNTLGRGTEITLFLKENATKYTKAENLKKLIEKYSEFIQFPIRLWITKTETKEVPKAAAETTSDASDAETKKSEEESISSDEVKVEDEEKPAADEKDEKPATEKITETKSEWEVVNKNKPIWTRRPSEVTKEEYNAFYKIISKEFDEPMSYVHFKGEGNVDFKAILYVPGHQPYDMFDVHRRTAAIRLYVKRVYITDQMDNMMPRYLNFIRGVVDSDDLPLNISRELLQNSKLMKLIQKKLVHKAISMIARMSQADLEGRKNANNTEAAKEEAEKKEVAKKKKTDEGEAEVSQFGYARFWKDFGKSIKLGIIEDASNRPRLVKFLRFYSNKSEWFLSSIDEYIDRMKPNQKYIYYLACSNIEECKKSPYLEELNRRDIEVLFLTDAIDEYCAQSIPTYNDKELMSIARDGLVLPGDDEEESKKELEKLTKEYEPLTKFMKNQLGERVHVVQVGRRLNQSPLVIISPKYGFSANMLRVMNAQTLTGQQQEMMSDMAGKLRYVEINPLNSITKFLNDRVIADAKDKIAENVVELLYQTALMRSGFEIGDTMTFAGRIFGITHQSLEHAPAPLTEEERKALEAEEKASKEKEEAAKKEGTAQAETKDEL